MAGRADASQRRLSRGRDYEKGTTSSSHRERCRKAAQTGSARRCHHCDQDNAKNAQNDEGMIRTSSLIFFQMILVISSPSSSTTGFWTTILFSAHPFRPTYSPASPTPCPHMPCVPTMSPAISRKRQERENASSSAHYELAATQREVERENSRILTALLANPRWRADAAAYLNCQPCEDRRTERESIILRVPVSG